MNKQKEAEMYAKQAEMVRQAREKEKAAQASSGGGVHQEHPNNTTNSPKTQANIIRVEPVANSATSAWEPPKPLEATATVPLFPIHCLPAPLS